jgi:integrase/recombinase XerD
MSRDLQTVKTRKLTAALYEHLSHLPPEVEWLANLTNKKTRRAHKVDVEEFLSFAGLNEATKVRSVTRAHVIAWRKDLEARGLESASIRRKLSALSSLFDYLCERNAVVGNPVDGVKRPSTNANEGSTPAGLSTKIWQNKHAPKLRRLYNASTDVRPVQCASFR